MKELKYKRKRKLKYNIMNDSEFGYNPKDNNDPDYNTTSTYSIPHLKPGSYVLNVCVVTNFVLTMR